MLTKLPRLTNLQMGGNQLSTVDASVAELRALTDLDLSGNRLITVDPAIARCEKLVYLNLENNMLTALPPEGWLHGEPQRAGPHRATASSRRCLTL